MKQDLSSLALSNRWKRWLKNEIQRDYICPVISCQRSYGSENSLN